MYMVVIEPLSIAYSPVYVITESTENDHLIIWSFAILTSLCSQDTSVRLPPKPAKQAGATVHRYADTQINHR